MFAGEAPFDVVEVGPQFGAQLLRFLQFAAHGFDARIERRRPAVRGRRELLRAIRSK